MNSSPVASDSRFESMARVHLHVVWITDTQGHFNMPQPTWESYTGQGWQDYRGLGWQKAIHPDDIDTMWRAWIAARDQRAMYAAVGRLWHAPSAQYRHIEVRAVPNVDALDVVREWIGTCIDVQERRTAERALRIADRRKDEFMAVLAHELRNPLAPIRNAVHVLKMCREDDARSVWARSIIERQVDQMARLLDDLLDLTRIARGKLEVLRERVNLAEAIERAVETSRPLLDAHGHRFELQLPDTTLLVEGDCPRLAQVFANLLNNAAKYTDRGGEIGMTVQVEGRLAVVRIRDNGMGIDPAMLQNLFRMYSQAAPARERAQGGLGIGLSLVRGLVAMHGGVVEARSEGIGRGSEFIVRLPLLRQEVLPARRSEPEAANVRPLRVLVADDNQDAVQTLAVLLEVLGHEVRIANDGAEAVDVAATFVPAVVLLDIGMPRIDGYDAARRIRELLPDSVLVATTGWGRQEDMRRAAAAGFDHHLVKPVNPEHLTRLLASVSRKYWSARLS